MQMKKMKGIEYFGRRLFSLFLAVCLTIAVGGEAFAGSLMRVSYTSDDNVWREFTDEEQRPIYLKKGKTYLQTIHAIDRWGLSYVYSAPETSDPGVATAQLEQSATAIKNQATGGVANSYLNLRIRAKECGKATITVTYDTFLTAEAKASYTDNRGSTFTSKTYQVYVVDNTLDIKAEWVDAPEYITVGNSDDVSSAEAFLNEYIKEGTDSIRELAVGGTTAVTVSSINDPKKSKELKKITGDWWKDVKKNVKKTIRKNKNLVGNVKKVIDTTNKAGKSLAKFPTLQGKLAGVVAWGLAMGIDAVLENALKNPPQSYPEKLRLKVTVRNNGNSSINNVKLKLSSDNLSMSGKKGPWLDVKEKEIRSLAGDAEAVYYFDVYPKLGSFQNIIGEEIYMGTIGVSGSYYDNTIQETLSSETAIHIPVRSVWSKEDEAAYNKEKNSAAGFWKTLGAFILCPVNVYILDKEGNEIAVLRNGSEEEYYCEGFYASTEGDGKYLYFDEAYMDEIQVRLQAVGDGTMSVVGVNIDENNITEGAVFSELAIQNGDVYELGFVEDEKVKLLQVEGDASRMEVEADYVFDRESIRQSLQKDGMQEKYLEKTTELILQGIAPEGIYQDFQQETTLEELMEALTALNEMYYGYMPEEEDAASLYGSIPDGLFDESELQASSSVKVTRLDTASILYSFLAYAGKSELSDTWHWIDIEADIETVAEENTETGTEADMETDAEYGLKNVAASTLYGAGIMDCAEDEKMLFGADKTITHEEMVEIICNLWNYLKLLDKKYDSAQILQTELLGVMSTFESDVHNYGVFMRSPDVKQEETVLGSFSLYLPTVMEAYYIQKSEAPVNEMMSVAVDIMEYWEEFSDKDVPIDLDRIMDEETGELKQFSVFSTTAGCLIGHENSITSIPVCILNEDGTIYEDAVYLVVINGSEGMDQEFVDTHDVKILGDAKMEITFIADQDLVRDYLESQRNILENKVLPTKNQEPESVEEYKELTVGSNGAEVQVLQQRLIDLGLLSGEADGAYGNMTAEAVAAYQNTAGLSVTGVADSQTQAMLYGVNKGTSENVTEMDEDLLLDWLDRKKK